jgi:hypothetical protein
MKTARFLVALCIIGACSINAAQSQALIDRDASRAYAYLGLGMGFDTPAGMIGFVAEVPVGNKFSLSPAAGIGSWGYKLSGGVNYYFNETALGSALGLHYTWSGGEDELKVSLPVEGNPNGEMVTMRMNPASSVNLSNSYSWRLGRKGKFSLFTGYAISLNEKPYDVISNHTLDEVSTATMKLIKPGGLILGLQFMFGI